MKRITTISILCLAGCLTARAGIDSDTVVIVLDASGSMGDHMGGKIKMDAAKQAIAEVLANVPLTTQVGLLVFSGNNKRNEWVFPLGVRDDEALLRALNPIQGSGNTPLGTYIKKGADRLLESRKDQLGYGTYRLLIVTDGKASDENLVQAYTPDVLSRGITVDVIGVDMEGDHLLASLAHSYRRADDESSLKRARAEVLAEGSIEGSAQADGEAFDLIQGLPDGMAGSMIASLSTQNDTPIDPVGNESTVAGNARPGQSSQGQGGGGSGRFLFFAIIVIFIVAGKLFKVVARRR
jgi:hypothetical protein